MTVRPPLYRINDKVFFTVVAKNGDFILERDEEFTIVGIMRSSSTEDVIYKYDLSQDPPLPYHNGKIHFQNIDEVFLFKEK